MENIICIRKIMHDDAAFVKMKALLESLLCYCLILQLYNMFPRLFRWIKNRQVVLKNVETTIRDVKYLITYLKETLDPDMCQGFVDCFLIWKQKEEVRRHVLSISNIFKKWLSVQNFSFIIIPFLFSFFLFFRNLVLTTLTTARRT